MTPRPRLDLMAYCVPFALGCALAQSAMDVWAWGHCVNSRGGLTCRVLKSDARSSLTAAVALALGIAYRQK